jgi:hypothetical protein
MGYAWTIVVDQSNGKVAVSLANVEGVFVLLGSCTVP